MASPNKSEPSRRPARGPRTWVAILVILAATAGLLVGVRFAGGLRGAWHRGVGRPAPAAAAAEQHRYYTCGMHPWVVLPEPGDCPICHMKLVPLDPAKFTGEIAIDPVTVQNIGVRVAPVELGPVERTIRTVGTVDFDETRVRDINTKMSGWIEKLYVDYLGAPVAAGDKLFDIYSPALYSAQEEYLLAWRNRDKVGADFLPEAAQSAARLLESARTKLEYFDITDAQIAALQASGKPAKTMTIRSPHGGVVIEKHANEGMKVDPGMRVFRIADLSKVWVMATLYEYQLPYVSAGQGATMTLSYVPGQQWQGRAIYVYPTLNERTREVKVRLEFDNPAGVLKPGMFANVQIRSLLAEDRVLVPRSAVIDTGERQVAFVSLGEGRFEPRQVQMGVQTGDGKVQVLDGLRPGEMVVVSGQFLLDSEAKVREALARMVRGQLAAEQQAAAQVAGRSELSIHALPPAAAAAIRRLLDDYFRIGDQLAADSADQVAAPARELAEQVDRLLAVAIPGDPHFWHRHDEAATVRGKALELAELKDIEQARLRFADLSVALGKLIAATGVPPAYPRQVQELHCPMYREGQGGTIWLQPAGDVRNPYFGATMLRCFDRRHTLPRTGGAATTAPDAAATQPEGGGEGSP